MGRLRFTAPGLEALLAEMAPRGYVAGIESIPWVTTCTVIGDQLLVDRETTETGAFSIPWRVPDYGHIMLSTSSLMERVEPYLLPLELARGTVNRLRNQAAAWQTAGLTLVSDLEEKMRSATATFAMAATSQHDLLLATKHAQKSMQLALQALEQLGEQYSQQALAARRQAGPLPTLLACRLEDVPEARAAKKIQDAFNAVVIPFSWRMIEANAGETQWDLYDRLIDWAHEKNLKVCGGPLMQLDQRSLPDWIYLWEDDWEELQSYLVSHVMAVVNRYKDRVHLWNVAGRINVDCALQLDEEQFLRLTVDAIETTRANDSRTPLIISFDQPWSEHLANRDRDLPPTHFADTLGRAALGVAGFGLELNWGYEPKGTLPRDGVELSRLIDRWTALGHPLLVTLTAPSSAVFDPLARSPAQPVSDESQQLPSAAWQSDVVEHLFPILLAKNAIQAIIWNQWTDTTPHEFPHGGLIDATGKAKPALKSLTALRRRYLS